MADPSLPKEFTDLLVTRARTVASILVDMLFLLVWVFAQWLARVATAGITLAGAEAWAIPIAHAIFALSTLAPILLYIYWDLQTIVRHGREATERERPGYPQRGARAADQVPLAPVSPVESGAGHLDNIAVSDHGTPR